MAGVLDSKVNITMFFQAMGARFQQLLAASMSDDEKLAKIISELERQVQEKRILAR